MDVLGNLVTVEEPNPAGGSLYSYYQYDVLGHLTRVDMARATGSQYRTFNYGTPPGPYLLSARNPENGTVTYTYNSNGTMATKTDAKGQQIQYSYDSYNRVTQIRHYAGGVEDTCQQVNFTYDSNSGFTYLLGRLATRSYSVCTDPNHIGNAGNPLRTDFVEMYGYTATGSVSNKRLRVMRTLWNQFNQPVVSQRDLEGSWTYDNEGKVTGVTYPAGSAGPMAGSYTLGYNSLGQPASMTDGNPAPLVSSVSYGVAGELLSVTGLYTETRSYNSRLQLTAMNGVTFAYATGNNGRIVSETASGETISYGYL